MSKLKITLVKSPAGKQSRQKLTIEALGLTRIGSSNVLPKNPQTEGMIRQTAHMLKVEEVK